MPRWAGQHPLKRARRATVGVADRAVFCGNMVRPGETALFLLRLIVCKRRKPAFFEEEAIIGPVQPSALRCEPQVPSEKRRLAARCFSFESVRREVLKV
jgi:hypothetical protein